MISSHPGPAGRVVVGVLAALTLLSFVHCGGDEAAEGGRTNAGGPTSATPAQFEPSEPGYLDVRPDGRVLLPGETMQIDAKVFDGDAPPVPATGLTFESRTPETVSVDAGGRVQAVALGLGEIVVRDGGRRERSILVPVLDAMPAGAVSVSFARPIVGVAAGAETRLPFDVLDGAGNRLTAEGVALSASPIGASSGAVETRIEANAAVLVAKMPGIVEVTAKSPAGPLFGRLVLMIFDPAVPHAQSCDDASWIFGGCWLNQPAETYTMPGVTDAARLELLEQRRCTGADFTIRYRQVAPSRIDIGDKAVLDVDPAGRLHAVAPGITGVGASWDRYACDCLNSRVYPDLNGCWNIACENGDEGWMSLAEWAPRVHRKRPPRMAFGGDQDFFRPTAHGKAALSNDGTPPFDCEASASFSPVVQDFGLMCGPANSGTAYPTHFGAHGASCTPNSACPGSSIAFCGGERHVSGVGVAQPTYIRGPAELAKGDCRITRGESCKSTGFSCRPYIDKEPSPPTTGSCSREFLSEACTRYASCPLTFQKSVATMEASIACFCDRSAQLRDCCGKAKTAAGNRQWSSPGMPNVFEFIGDYENPEPGVPVYCSIAAGQCVGYSDPGEQAACTQIKNDLDACNAQNCAFGDWETYATACEEEGR